MMASVGPDLRPTRDDLLRRAVLNRVQPLQRLQLSRQPAAAGRLARLRRALTAAPGSDADVWPDTIGALPAELLGHDDTANSFERATHAAMCLYALHQQSQPLGMHVLRQDLGTAVQVLRPRNDTQEGDVDPVLRRFHALATATSYEETLYHLRGVVTLLRAKHVGLDYGQLAVDLRRLQSGKTAPGVRLAWGRGLYRRPPVRTPATADNPEPETSPGSTTDDPATGDDT